MAKIMRLSKELLFLSTTKYPKYYIPATLHHIKNTKTIVVARIMRFVQLNKKITHALWNEMETNWVSLRNTSQLLTTPSFSISNYCNFTN